MNLMVYASIKYSSRNILFDIYLLYIFGLLLFSTLLCRYLFKIFKPNILFDIVFINYFKYFHLYLVSYIFFIASTFFDNNLKTMINIIFIHLMPALILIYFWISNPKNKIENEIHKVKYVTYFLEKFRYIIVILLGLPLHILSLRESSYWRETQTLMTVRQYSENSLNLFKPRTFIIESPNAGNASYINGELPILQFILGIVGRVDFLLVQLTLLLILWFGIYQFDKLLDEFCKNSFVKFICTLTFSFLPYIINFGTAVMPDFLNMIFIVMSVRYFIVIYLHKEKTKKYKFWCSLLMVGLTKLTGFYVLGILFGSLFINSNWKNNLIENLNSVPILLGILALNGYWYFIWTNELLINGGLDVVGPIREANRIRTIEYLFNFDIVFNFIYHIGYFVLNPISLIFCILSVLAIKFDNKEKYYIFDNKRLIIFWIISVLLYTLFLFGANVINGYYQISMIIPTILFGIRGIEFFYDKFKISNHLRITIVLAIVIMIILIPRNISFLEHENIYHSERFKVGEYIKNNSNKDWKVAVNDNGNPSILEHAEREGWTGWLYEYDNNTIFELMEHDLKYFVWNSLIPMDEEIQNIFILYFMQIYVTNDYFLFKIIENS